MSDTSIALNRFGYGLRDGEMPPGDPKGFLLRQLRDFDPRPGALSSRPETSGQAGELLKTIRASRKEQRSARSEGPSAAMMMQESMTESQADRRSNREKALDGLPPEVANRLRDAFGLYRSDAALRTRIAVTSPTPFAERLTHFWANHFSVTAGKPGTSFEVGNHEFYAIRPHVTGRFSDMLKAAVLHPAMLLYLDQYQSVGPASRFAQRRQRRRNRDNSNNQQDRGLNENLAREVLELHTLGVDGGYSQGDVTEFARALTGWTLPGLSRLSRFSEKQPGGTAYVSIAHEPGKRRIMGRSYADTGAQQALSILDDLAAHPATARHVATKLARHFAGDEPPPALVTRLERDFRATNGDLASLARTLVNAPESWTAGPVKFRQPYEWFTSVLRFTGLDDLSERRLNGVLRQLGQAPWRAPSPAGFDDVAESWAGPDAIVRRVELAERIARNAPAGDVLERAARAYPDALSANTRTWISRAESGSQALGLLLVAPEMMRR